MKPRLSLKARALQLLAQREHSRVELRRKLLAHAGQHEAIVAAAAVPPAAAADVAPPLTRRRPPSPAAQADVEELLDWLVANRYLNEARFVEARVRNRAARQGNLRITQELARHGIRLGAEEQQALKDSEFARARQVWARKFDGPPADAAARAKHARFLAGRGFSPDVIRRLLRGEDD